MRGSPRVVPVTAAEEDALNGSATATADGGGGLGAPLRREASDLIDPPAAGKKEKRRGPGEVRRRLPRRLEGGIPTPSANGEAPFNPRARGVVGKKTEAAAE